MILGERGCRRLKVRRMTLETARQHRPIKVCRPIYISWTVDPAMQLGPVRNRKLEQSILLPIEIGLALGGRANHKIDLLLTLGHVSALLLGSSFVKMTRARFHPKGKLGVKRRHHVLTYGEVPRDRGCIRQARSSMMSGRAIGSEFLLMARLASEISHEAIP